MIGSPGLPQKQLTVTVDSRKPGAVPAYVLQTRRSRKSLYVEQRESEQRRGFGGRPIPSVGVRESRNVVSNLVKWSRLVKVAGIHSSAAN